MKRDQEMDALAEAIAQAQSDRPSWLARLARRLLVRAVGPVLVAVAIAVLLAKVGVSLGSLLMPMVYVSPFLAVVVASFITYAWGQNTGLTYIPVMDQADLAAEPGQVGQPELASHLANDLANQPASELASPTRPALPSVTVTVLPVPAAELPRAVGQGAAIHYPAEEETRG